MPSSLELTVPVSAAAGDPAPLASVRCVGNMQIPAAASTIKVTHLIRRMPSLPNSNLPSYPEFCGPHPHIPFALILRAPSRKLKSELLPA